MSGFLEQFNQKIINNENRIAVTIINGDSCLFKDFKQRLDKMNAFLSNFSVNTRFLLLVENSIDYLAMSFSIIENQTLIFEDYDLFEDKYRFTIDFADVDVVICDSFKHPIMNIVDDFNISVFLFDSSSFSFEQFKKGNSKNRESDKRISYVIQTSGTTSHPKLFEVDFDAYLARDQFLKYDHLTKFVQLAKLTRVLTVTSSIRVLANMGEVILMRYFSPTLLFEYLNSHELTYLSGPPAVWSYINDSLLNSNFQITNYKPYLLTIGSAINESILNNLEKRLNGIVVNSYGLTETGIISTTFHCENSKGTVGQIHLPFKIIDDEVCISGKTVIQEYLGKESKDSFKDGWFMTGDIGYINELGYLVLVGRKKEMINRGGEKVSPFEIEALLSQHKDIREVVVFPYQSELEFEEVGCAVVLYDNAKLSLKDIREYLNKKVATFKLPSILVVLDKMPYQASYKVNRNTFYQENLVNRQSKYL